MVAQKYAIYCRAQKKKSRLLCLAKIIYKFSATDIPNT